MDTVDAMMPVVAKALGTGRIAPVKPALTYACGVMHEYFSQYHVPVVIRSSSTGMYLVKGLSSSRLPCPRTYLP